MPKPVAKPRESKKEPESRREAPCLDSSRGTSHWFVRHVQVRRPLSDQKSVVGHAVVRRSRSPSSSSNEFTSSIMCGLGKRRRIGRFIERMGAERVRSMCAKAGTVTSGRQYANLGTQTDPLLGVSSVDGIAVMGHVRSTVTIRQRIKPPRQRP